MTREQLGQAAARADRSHDPVAPRRRSRRDRRGGRLAHLAAGEVCHRQRGDGFGRTVALAVGRRGYSPRRAAAAQFSAPFSSASANSRTGTGDASKPLILASFIRPGSVTTASLTSALWASEAVVSPRASSAK